MWGWRDSNPLSSINRFLAGKGPEDIVASVARDMSSRTGPAKMRRSLSLKLPFLVFHSVIGDDFREKRQRLPGNSFGVAKHLILWSADILV
jgi:hypothetical protein